MTTVRVKTMKAMRIGQYGGPEQLHFEDVDVPMPAADQVLVHIQAASVNPVDVKLATGKLLQLKFPWIPGGDFSGIIEAVGEGATDLREGQEVFGSTPGGGSYAQYAVTKADFLSPKPSKLNHIQAASVPLAGQTAWQGLFEVANLRDGQTVLIHGASGGVGSFAVQFARWAGARVIATCSAANADFVNSLGADLVIDYKTQAFWAIAKDVDVVLDTIGGEIQEKSFQVLKPGGFLVALTQRPDADLAAKKNVHAAIFSMQASSKRISQIGELANAGDIKTVVSKTYLLYEANRAWVDIMSGHTRGKIVLEVP